MSARSFRVVVAASVAVAVAAAGVMVTRAAGVNEPPPRIAFLARGDGTNYADALVVGSMAGQLGAPVFITAQGSLPAATAQALADYGPQLLVIAGGEAAVSQAVEVAARSAAGLSSSQVVRVAGANRYETAAELAGLFDALDVNPAYLRADEVDGLLPITVFSVASNGSVRNSRWRWPMTGPPSVTRVGAEYTVSFPNASLSSSDVVVCSTRIDPGFVRATEQGGAVLVETLGTDGVLRPLSFDCVVHRL